MLPPSALLDVPLTDAARNVVPIIATASENVQNLRAWANGRCLSADRPGLYQHQAAPKASGKAARKSTPQRPGIQLTP